MEKIINAFWKQEGQNVRKLARWVRCLFQMTMTIDPTMSLKCLENARVIAARAREIGVCCYMQYLEC